MNRERKRLGSLGTLLLFSGITVLGCGSPDASEGEGAAPATGGDAPAAQAAGSTDCSAFTDELLTRVGFDYQLYQQLDPGRVDAMEEMTGLPDPAALRTFADLYAGLDVSEVAPGPFEPPADIAPDQRRLADLLEAALAARDDPSDPAWAAFETFVEERVTAHQLSYSYYLSEAGCR